MKPTTTLPQEYEEIAEFDLQNNRKLLIWLNVIGILLLIGLIPLFSGIAAWLRPELESVFSIEINSLWQIFEVLLGAAFALVGVLVLHEAVHGFFFWVFSGRKPKFGFKGAYAFAAMPDCYLPKWHYLVVGLSPLVVLSLAGVALMPVFPQRFLWVLLASLVINASGAVGDLAVCGWLLLRPANTYALDFGDAIRFYGLKNES